MNMKVEKMVSIIIPVYNSEKYIECCLQSVFAQTYTNYEVIIVDDGSTDKTISIINRIVKRKEHVVLLRKPNGGVSSARNFGIQYSRGEYVTFIDSDDIIDRDYLSTLITPLVENNYDFVMSGILFFSENNNKTDIQILPSYRYDLSKKDNWFLLATSQLITSPVAKLYRTSIIKHNQIRFNEEFEQGEDRDFNVSYLPYIESAISVSYVGYRYRRNVSGSLSAKYQENNFFIDVIYWNKLKSLLEMKGCAIISTSYMTNRLFNIIIDDFMEMYKNKGLSYTLSHFSMIHIDKQYLYDNKNIIQSSYWMRTIVLLMLRFCK